MHIVVQGQMKSKENKTVLKTIRLTDKLERILQNDAKIRKVNVGTLLSSLVTKYAEWDRFTEKYGFVSMPREAMKLIIDLVDIDKLKDAAKRYYGAGGPIEFLTFRSKKIDLESVLEHISSACKYAGSAELDIGMEGRNHVITIHHSLGQKWSEILAFIWADGLIKNKLGLSTRNEINNNSLVIRFSEE